jgi:hypothetical protein
MRRRLSLSVKYAILRWSALVNLRLTELCSGPEQARFQGRKGCREVERSWPAAEALRPGY